MIIVGTGFLGHHFQPLADRHSDVLLFCAGVSNSLCEDAAEFKREADLLYSAVRHCLTNHLCLVYFSSAGMVYGHYESKVSEDGPAFPRSTYGRHKLAMETVIRLAGVRHLILRLSNPVGPRQQPYQLLPSLYNQVRRGFVEVWRGAHRDLIDVQDVVSLTDALLEARPGRETFNLASGQSVPVESIVDYLERKLGMFVLRNYLERSDAYEVCIDRLRAAIPREGWAHFTATYYQSVLDRYYFTPGADALKG
jgi:nucleoside-diphosphate-sugar epimerase